jgi:choline dehydrogenase-like flavoprotein
MFIRVKGVKGLRVVDASVIPRTPSSNLNAPVMAVAEKISQEILKEYA